MSSITATTQDLLPDMCRQFLLTTGWNLTFHPAAWPFEAQEAELEQDRDCCWYARISDGFRPAGFLVLRRSEDRDERVSFVEATGLAESMAQLLGRLAEAATHLTLRNNDVSTLLNLGLAIPAQDDLAFSLSQLLKAATHLTNSRSAAFFLLDVTTSRLKLRAVYQLARDEVPLSERELRDSRPDLRALVDEPVVVRATSTLGQAVMPPAMRVALVAGVQSEQAPFGTLWVYDRRDKQYSDRDRHVLQSIAAQVASALERSALLRGSEQHERIHRDLKAASESQCDISPDDLPADPRFEMAARCTSCHELGGDLCEVIRLSPDRISLAVGDASGNSIPAAMIMSAARGALRAHPLDAEDVTRLMAQVNNALCHITRSHQFMSLCYGVLDAASWKFTYCNAGHPSPLLIRGGETTPLESHGLLLGVLPEAEYRYSELQLAPQDLLVFYSDGISEAQSSEHRLFRSEGIEESVRGAMQGTAQQILDTVWKRVDQHMAAGAVADDRTLLVLRIR